MKHLSNILARRDKDEQGNMIIWLFVMFTVVAVAGGVATLVAQSSKVTQRRGQMIQAVQYAQGAVVIACNDMNQAFTNAVGTFPYNLTNSYTRVSGTVFQRTIAAPFSNQTATVTITLPYASASSATIKASATVGAVTQTATGNVRFGWGYPGAIISVNAGMPNDYSNAKSDGQGGNVAINGGNAGPIVVNGGPGYAVMANGRVNYDTNYVKQSTTAYYMTNWGTAKQIPDYTSQGTVNALFDLNRLIAVANATTNGYSQSGNNHFTNISDFMLVANNYSNAFTKAMEGVIVVDVSTTDPDQGSLTTSAFSSKTTITAATTDKKTGITTPASTNTVATGGLPYGINVHGTLLLNFTGSGWDPVTEKIIVTAPINVNAANLSGLVATNPATYTTGYPPVYTNRPSNNPINIDITHAIDPATGTNDFNNFQVGDNLPAVIYSTGCLDTHGNCNICGVLYTPCYIELENKQDGQTQYVNGCVIMGHGIYYENNSAATSIINFDPNTVNSLTTLGNAGKSLLMSFWSQ